MDFWPSTQSSHAGHPKPSIHVDEASEISSIASGWRFCSCLGATREMVQQGFLPVFTAGSNPHPTFLEVFMVNNLVFRRPKRLFLIGLGGLKLRAKILKIGRGPSCNHKFAPGLLVSGRVLSRSLTSRPWKLTGSPKGEETSTLYFSGASYLKHQGV